MPPEENELPGMPGYPPERIGENTRTEDTPGPELEGDQL